MKQGVQSFLSILLACILVAIVGCSGGGGSDSSDDAGSAPNAEITSPANNSTYTSGDIVAFVGTGTDVKDGLLPESEMVWTSSRDGEIKSGSKSFSISTLTVGTHTITLTVMDSVGASGTASLTVTILPQVPSGDTITNTLGMTFVKINPGTFWMGSPEDEPGRLDNETRHQVTLTKGYYMQSTEVTQGQWYAVMNTHPSFASNCGDNCPVEDVSWDDAKAFIYEMNRREPTRNYRLPTEAEWEYACRAGSTAAFTNGGIRELNCGNDPNLNAAGWYCGNANSTPHSVAQKQANAWGLYDMHGNVSEYCSDWYEGYPSSSETDPTGPSSGLFRVVRGGSFFYDASSSRSASRDLNWILPDTRLAFIGFRLVLLPGQ